MSNKEDKFTHLPLPAGKKSPAKRSELLQRGIRDLAKLKTNKTKVLVVDDEEFLVEIIRERLDSEGYQTEGAKNGSEALERLRTFNADVVLCGFMMPVMRGDTFLIHCKANHPTLPVILMTANERWTNQKAKELGAAGFLSKPFPFDDLFKLIESVMG